MMTIKMKDGDKIFTAGGFLIVHRHVNEDTAFVHEYEDFGEDDDHMDMRKVFTRVMALADIEKRMKEVDGKKYKLKWED